MTNLEAALLYAELGWLVFPLAVRAKVPLLKGGHGWEDGTRDLEQIRHWWTDCPGANVGVVVGAGSNLCVLDVDPRAGGDESLAGLIARRGPLPVTLEVATGGGGRHYYFAYDERARRCTIAPGLELKARAGYIVAPPSAHPNGGVYRWTRNEGSPAPLPSWLLGEPVQVATSGHAPRYTNGPIPDGERNATLARIAGALRRHGATETSILAALRAENAARCKPPLPDHEVETIAVSIARYAPTNGSGPASKTSATGVQDNPWDAAVDAHDFLSASEPDADFLVRPLIVRGSVTAWFSPRGLGKTLIAHWIAVDLARRAFRVLLIDRDNPRREVRRRLRAWGLEGVDRERLKVICRDEAPPLTDVGKWKLFPVGAYDLVILDSFDSSAEGVGEQDSSKSSLAVGALLDVVRGTAGPAALILGNTIKSGSHGRGSGVLEDRFDIAFEVRDATGFTPSGTKDWWLELPASGRDAWADRASRRKRRDTYRLAFVPSKYRVGEEPDPLALEIACSTEPWQCRDVTTVLRAEAAETRAEAAHAEAIRLERATTILEAEVWRRASTGKPLPKNGGAVELLVDLGLSREVARALIAERAGQSWAIAGTARRGDPEVLVPTQSEMGAAGKEGIEGRHRQRQETAPIPAGLGQSGPQETTSSEPAPTAACCNPTFLPLISTKPGDEGPVELLPDLDAVRAEMEQLEREEVAGA